MKTPIYITRGSAGGILVTVPPPQTTPYNTTLTFAIAITVTIR